MDNWRHPTSWSYEVSIGTSSGSPDCFLLNSLASAIRSWLLAASGSPNSLLQKAQRGFFLYIFKQQSWFRRKVISSSRDRRLGNNLPYRKNGYIPALQDRWRPQSKPSRLLDLRVHQGCYRLLRCLVDLPCRLSHKRMLLPCAFMLPNLLGFTSCGVAPHQMGV